MFTVREKKKIVVYSSFIAMSLFAIRFALFFLPQSWQSQFTDGTMIGFLIAVGEHVFMLPIIWIFPAPRWAKVCGSLWVLNDVLTDMLAITGFSSTIFLTERYWGHLFFASPWFFAAGWNAAAPKKIRWLAWITAFFLALYTVLFLLFHTPGFALIPVAISLPLWLLFVGLWFMTD